MRKQVAALQREVALLKSALQMSDGGSVQFVARCDKKETVGANSVTEIGGNLQESIGGSHSETVGGNTAITIGADQSTSVGRDLALKSGRNADHSIWPEPEYHRGERGRHQRRRSTDAENRPGSIILKKNGEVTINGTNVRAKASGESI